MKLEWSRQSLEDIDSIVAHIAQDDPRAAFDLADDILGHVERNLPENPNMGRVGRVTGTRELVVHENYVVAYEVTDKVVVLAVVHSARLWPTVF